VLRLQSLLNVHGLAPEAACEAIRHFEWTSDAIDAYEADGAGLYKRLRDVDALSFEMLARSQEIINICEAVLVGCS
jgi:hypothetical protein